MTEEELAFSMLGLQKKGCHNVNFVTPTHYTPQIVKALKILKFIATEISKESYVNIMMQYRPMYKAYEYKELNRSLKMSEYRETIDIAREWGLHRGFERV